MKLEIPAGLLCLAGRARVATRVKSDWVRFRFSDLHGDESTCMFTGATRPGTENVMIDKKHNKEDLPVKTGQAKTADPELMQSSTGTAGPASSLSRRKFLGRVSVSAAAMATAVGVPSSLAKHRIESGSAPRSEALTQASDEDGDQSRKERAFRIRLKTAIAERNVPVPPQVDNGDELLYPSRIGNYSKGLAHNSIGEVDSSAYDALLTAVTSGEPEDFAKIPLGGTVKLATPQGGLAFTLEGTDSGQLTCPPAPALSSAERAGEMVENYWMALAREVPFSKYDRDPTALMAITDLNKLSDFTGPKANGQVTPGTLFRGTTPGELIGPYISQFLLRPVGFGPLNLAQKYITYASGVDYLTDVTSFGLCHDGKGPFAKNVVAGTSYIKNGRDLGTYVKVDTVGQANFIAALWLLANGVPFNSGNPYLTSANQMGGLNFGNQHILTLLNEVSIVALRACFYQKWFVHRHVRPEEYGGLVHNVLTGKANYPIHSELLNSKAAKAVFSRYGTYLLPAAYPEGCPQHPSYPEAHGSVAGAGVTVLKAFFDESTVLKALFDASTVIPKPTLVVPSDDGQSLLPYTGSDDGQITVGGELNKLANNVALGRDMATVHWRSDGYQSMLLGEAVAISILRDQHRTFNEPFDGFTFTKFDGATITV